MGEGGIQNNLLCCRRSAWMDFVSILFLWILLQAVEAPDSRSCLFFEKSQLSGKEKLPSGILKYKISGLPNLPQIKMTPSLISQLLFYSLKIYPARGVCVCLHVCRQNLLQASPVWCNFKARCPYVDTIWGWGVVDAWNEKAGAGEVELGDSQSRFASFQSSLLKHSTPRIFLS